MEYTIHPAAACYPMIEGEDWQRFKAAIERNGDNNEAIKINTVTGYVLDGRNRLRAYQELGREPKIEYVEIQPENELAYIKSLNEERRHMDKAQSAAVAAKLATLEHGTNQFQKKVDGQNCPSIKPISNSEAAQHLGVHVNSVKLAKKTARTDPELFEAQYQGGRPAMRELQAQRKAAQTDRSAQPKPKVLVINPELSGKMRQWFMNLDTLIAMEQKTNLPIPLIDPKDLQVIETILPRIVAFIQEQKDAHLNDPRNRAREGNDRAILVPGSTDIH